MKTPARGRSQWWQKPGLGLVYQIEYRPGWDWDRDYSRFNASMKNASGDFSFDGPDCRIPEWVDFSTNKAAADYHILEIKWHDGICFFNTSLTDWKSEKDYALEFARLSRESGIPFMFYYSAVFDHNPMFDHIQPDATVTPSFIGLYPGIEYLNYLKGQYAEIIEQYAPDGMWFDWYWADGATEKTIELFKRDYPETVITFNLSNYYSTAYGRLDFTSGEAHTLSGPYVKLRTESSGVKVPVFSNAWKWANLNRALFDHPWELITPAGKWWQDHSLREDPLDLLRMAAIVMACGGKICPGLTARMDGTIYPDQIQQLTVLGDWYGPRKPLFNDSAPLRYRLRRVPGVRVSNSAIKTVCAMLDEDYILHLVNMTGVDESVDVEFSDKVWNGIERVVLEPGGGELTLERGTGGFRLRIPAHCVDKVDTILRITIS